MDEGVDEGVDEESEIAAAIDDLRKAVSRGHSSTAAELRHLATIKSLMVAWTVLSVVLAVFFVLKGLSGRGMY